MRGEGDVADACSRRGSHRRVFQSCDSPDQVMVCPPRRRQPQCAATLATRLKTPARNTPSATRTATTTIPSAAPGRQYRTLGAGQLAPYQRGIIPALVPGIRHPGRGRPGHPRPLRPPGQRHGHPGPPADQPGAGCVAVEDHALVQVMAQVDAEVRRLHLAAHVVGVHVEAVEVGSGSR